MDTVQTFADQDNITSIVARAVCFCNTRAVSHSPRDEKDPLGDNESDGDDQVGRRQKRHHQKQTGQDERRLFLLLRTNTRPNVSTRKLIRH